MVLLATWRLDLPAQTEGQSAVKPTLSSRRVLSERAESLASGASSFASSQSHSARDGGVHPRVSPFDKIAPSPSAQAAALDAGKDENDLSVIAEAKKADLENQTEGIRMRLLIEAAERSLTSPTPWADLSLVALSFQRVGNEEAARYWFKRASRLALDPDDAGAASRALREVVKNAVSAGFYELATELITRIPEEGEKLRARAELVRAYARKKDFQAAHQLAETLGDLKARGQALRSIVESETRFLGLSSALETLQTIHDPAERDRALSSVITIRASMGDYDGSANLLEQISNPRTRDATLTQVTHIQDRGSAFSQEALAGLLYDPTFRDPYLRELISQESTRAGFTSEGSSPPLIETTAERAKAYESLVSLQLRHGDLVGALGHARSISQQAARNRSLQAVAVAEVKDHGVKAARHTANLIRDLKLRETTYAKIAQRAAVYGENKGAVDTIQYIRTPAQRALAYANVGLTQARYGRDRSARVLVQDATRELAKVSSPRAKARAQGLVAQIFAETGDASSALRAAAEIGSANLRDSTYQQVALSFAKIVQPAIAAQSARLIEREATRERALSSVATTLAKKVSYTNALKFAARLDGRRQQVRFLLGVAERKS